MGPKRRHAWVGFAIFAALAIVGLLVLDGAAAGAVLLGALLTFILACIYVLHGEEADARAQGDRTGLSGWFGHWL